MPNAPYRNSAPGRIFIAQNQGNKLVRGMQQTKTLNVIRATATPVNGVGGPAPNDTNPGPPPWDGRFLQN